MRSWFGSTCWLWLVLLAGCKSSSFSSWFMKNEPDLKPPPAAEQYILPPEADARFSRPIQYPDGVLERGNRKRDNDPLKPPPAGIGQGMNGGGNPANPGGNFR